MVQTTRAAVDDLLAHMAQLTGTERADWHAVFKCRHGMQAVLQEVGGFTGKREVVTQLFTCVTAVDPILAAGLVPRYVDIDPASLAIDPAQVEAGKATCAVMAQHTFGIVDAAQTNRLRTKAHEAGALLLEDSAHCVGRMARDISGAPMADVSFHSFGVEKVLPGVYFGGAVWVNPAMEDNVLRERICVALANLPELPAAVERVTHRYRNHMRVFTRVPQGLSSFLRTKMAARGLFEPAVAEEERRGRVRHRPCLPSPWVAEQALAALQGLAANEAQRRACTEAYLAAFSQVPADDAQLLIPAGARGCAADQPLLRFPTILGDTDKATRLIDAVAAQGHYAQAWPRPLLLPGVLDAQAYGLAGGTGAWPISERMSAGVVGLPTDIDPEAVPAVAQAALDIARA